MTVYFIEAVGTDRVKIGHARSVDARLDALRLCSPLELQLLKTVEGGQQEERELHARFAEHRDHGEWFQLSPLRDFIESLTEDHFQKARTKIVEEAVVIFEQWLKDHDTTPYRFALDNGIDPSVIRKNLLHHRSVSLETALKIEKGTGKQVPAKLFIKNLDSGDPLTLLRTWLVEHRTTINRFAIQNGLDPSLFSKLMRGETQARRISADLANKIERATGGAVPVSVWAVDRDPKVLVNILKEE